MILVLGGHGQVGAALARASSEVLAVDRATVDITRPRDLAPLLARLRPRAIVNAAAYTAVDRAERDRATAFRVNADGAGHVARAAAAAGVPLVHLSTDYVFDGTRAPYGPDSDTAPLGVYGASKLAGEDAVRAEAPASVILRTAWVFGRTRGFVAAMIRRGLAGTPLRVVDDQLGQPTPADQLATAILAVVDQLDHDAGDAGDAFGTWHVAGQPATTWCGLTREALAVAGARVPVGAIPTSAWPTAARRPLDTRLDTSAFEARFGVRIDWRAALPQVADAVKNGVQR